MEAVSIRPASHRVRKIRKLRVSQRRIDANRRNATRSTGPRTPEGKARVRLNAMRHGCRARDEICLAAAGDDALREIAVLFEYLCEGLQAVGLEQCSLVYRLAHAAWKLRRAFELGERERYWEAASRPAAERARLLALMGALTAYESKAGREFDRALEALLGLQRASLHENRRSNPLARRSRASAHQRSEGSLRSPGHRPSRCLCGEERDNEIDEQSHSRGEFARDLRANFLAAGLSVSHDCRAKSAHRCASDPLAKPRSARGMSIARGRIADDRNPLCRS